MSNVAGASPSRVRTKRNSVRDEIVLTAAAALGSKLVVPSSPLDARWVRRIRIVSALVLVASALLLVRVLPVDRMVAVLSVRIEHMGVWAPVVFGVVYLVAALLFVPGSALTLTAGAVFGLGLGTLTVSLASTMAAMLAFLLGRHVARDAVARMASRSTKFAALDRAIAEGGWKVIALLRLSPAMPFSLGNYLFGLTRIRFWPYAITSWLAMLPGTFLYVYLGHVGRSGVTAASSGGSSGRTPAEWGALLVGLLATVLVTFYVTRLARRALRANADVASPAANDATPAAPATPPGSGRRGTFVMAISAVALATCAVLAQGCRSKLSAMFGPPPVTLGETFVEKPGGPSFDHSAFDGLLRRHVDGDGYVDYKGLASEGAILDRYVAEVGRAPVERLGRNERLALLLNAYNAFTLRLILDYSVASIKDIPSAKRWDDERWNIGGARLSLTAIEHEQIRPNFREPRIHFALVCAAVGCPPLRAEAYAADRLETQLLSQTIYVHSHPRWFQFDAAGGRLHLTALYDWYGGDFTQVASSITEYAARNSPPLRRALDAGRTPRVDFLDYDWALNSTENRR